VLKPTLSGAITPSDHPGVYPGVIDMTGSDAVDADIAALPPEPQTSMMTLRATIRAAAPDAEEVITYKRKIVEARVAEVRGPAAR